MTNHHDFFGWNDQDDDPQGGIGLLFYIFTIICAVAVVMLAINHLPS